MKLTGAGPWPFPDGDDDLTIVLTPGHTDHHAVLFSARHKVRPAPGRGAAPPRPLPRAACAGGPSRRAPRAGGARSEQRCCVPVFPTPGIAPPQPLQALFSGDHLSGVEEDNTHWKLTGDLFIFEDFNW